MKIIKNISKIPTYFAHAKAAVKGRYSLPTPLGKCIHDNTTSSKIEKILKSNKHMIGYHGTGASGLIKKQIEQSEFDPMGKRIYFDDAGEYVGMYACEIGQATRPIIIELASETPPQTDEIHNTFYFPEDAKVFIIKAYEVNPEFILKKSEIKDSSILSRVFLFSRLFFQAWQNRDISNLTQKQF